MIRTIENALKSSGTSSLAETFSRLGWIGFWMQIAIGAIPVALILYALLFDRSSGSGTRAGLVLVEYLTIASLLVLAFTTIWFYRYTRLATRIADPEGRPPVSSVQRAAWTGIAAARWASCFLCWSCCLRQRNSCSTSSVRPKQESRLCKRRGDRLVGCQQPIS